MDGWSPLSRHEESRRLLLDLYREALNRVEGRAAVAQALRRHALEPPVHAIALGKAGAAMMAGALLGLGEGIVRGLVLTRHGHGAPLPPRIECLEGGHPIPDASSLAAGRRLLMFIEEIPPDARVLFLLSGGASAIAEALPEGVDLEALGRISGWLLASGHDIGQMNRVRKGLSLIKGGRLAQRLAGRATLNLIISDVPGDDPKVIGSGPLIPHAASDLIPPELPAWAQPLIGRAPAPPPVDAPFFSAIRTEIIASNADARHAVAQAAKARGMPVRAVPEPAFEGDAVALGRAFVRRLRQGPPGLYVWGGESTSRLPPEPGRGGRCQSMALAAAMELEGEDNLLFLAAGTDGSDGPTEDAGAVVDGGTVARGRKEGLDPSDHLHRADAGTFLEASGDLVQTGPTGTNVMDLVIALRMA